MLVASWRGARRRRSTGSRTGSSSVEAAGLLSPEVRGVGGGLGAWVAGWVDGLQVVCVGCRAICYCSSSTTEAAQHRLAAPAPAPAL